MDKDNLEYGQKQIDRFSQGVTYFDALVSLINGHYVDVR